MKKLILFMAALVVLVVIVAQAAVALLKPEPIGPAVSPEPSVYSDAVVQVYGADVWGIRGRFAIHTWIATKAVNAPSVLSRRCISRHAQ